MSASAQDKRRRESVSSSRALKSVGQTPQIESEISLRNLHITYKKILFLFFTF